MNEERPIILHFFVKEHVTNFGNVCRKHGVTYTVREEANDPWQRDGYFVDTEPVKSTLRRNIIADWAKASMEVL